MRSLVLSICAGLSVAAWGQEHSNTVPRDSVLQAQKLIGLEFSDAKTDLMLPGLAEQRDTLAKLRAFPLSNSVPPALWFNPVPPGVKLDTRRAKPKFSSPGKVRLPRRRDDLAFYSVAELGALIRTRQITSVELTRFFLDRLQRHGPRLECVVTLTESLALEQARAADAEIARGKYRGPLHGIPYGAKDLLATKGVPTTWGSAPFTNQVFDTDATVVARLREAGAVLVAKTTLGELAWGDVWFGGTTRNPWNLAEGSSGSSAGSAAGTAAGLLPFAVGTETCGSIVSPCDRCGATGLRPSFGRVSRTGAMALSWSMDRLGPIGRTVEDCALVFNAIYGPDGLDPSVIDLPFNYTARIDLKKLRLGFLAEDFAAQKGERKTHDEATLAEVRSWGCRLEPVAWPKFPLDDLMVTLSVEAAAAFEDLTRSGRDDLMKRQERAAWPNVFREARFVPAVEYLQAQRIRTLVVEETARLFERVDAVIAPSQTGNSLVLGSLTGNPCVVVPNGFRTNGTPTSICFIGRLFDEARLLAIAKAYQDATGFHRRHPPEFRSRGEE